MWPSITDENQAKRWKSIEVGSIDESIANHSHISNTINSFPASNNPLKGLVAEEILERVDSDNNKPIEVLSDNAIIHNVLNQQQAKEEDCSIPTQISWSVAANALNTFLKFIENRNHYDTAEVMNLHTTQNEL